MHPLSHTVAALVMLALHAGAWAGPVPAAEADAVPAATALPSVHAQGLGESQAAEAAASAPAGSALAVEIIKEADAGATATEAPRHPKREGASAVAQPMAPSPPPRNQANAGDDPWGLRDMGKATVQWVKEAIPWLRSDEDARDAGKGVSLDTTDWATSPLQGGQAGHGARLASNSPNGAAAADPVSTVGYGDVPRPKVVGPEQNMVRVISDAVRELLAHPMTWLVVALVVIGGIVVKKIDRRPTE